MTTIILPERCDRSAAEALLPEFVAAMGADAVAVDAGKVTHMGQAVLQLLVSARRACDGLTIAASPALRDAARLTGLDEVLFDAGGAA